MDKPTVGAPRAAKELEIENWSDEDAALAIQEHSGLRRLLEAVKGNIDKCHVLHYHCRECYATATLIAGDDEVKKLGLSEPWYICLRCLREAIKGVEE